MQAPPPAVIGPPPRPGRDAYLPLLPPIRGRDRSSTIKIKQEYQELRSSQPRDISQRSTLNRNVPPRKPPPLVPKRSQSLMMPQNTARTAHLVDFSQWRSACTPLYINALEYIVCYGTQYEGVFRVSGDFAKINEMAAAAKSGALVSFKQLPPCDVFNVADFILQWTQSEYDSLISDIIYKQLIDLTKTTIDGNDVKGLIYCLPQERLYTLLAMLQLCQMLLANESITKMNSGNLATCIAPNMMFDPLQIDIKIIQKEAEQCNRIFKFLIENFFSFKEDIENGRTAQYANKFKNQVGGGVGFATQDEREGRSKIDERESKSKGILGFRKSRSRSKGRKKGHL